MDKYAKEHDGAYPTSLAQLKPDYLKEFPKCFAAGEMTYVAEFGPKAPGNPDKRENFYFVKCGGEFHKNVQVPQDYPQYNSEIGLIER